MSLPLSQRRRSLKKSSESPSALYLRDSQAFRVALATFSLSVIAALPASANTVTWTGLTSTDFLDGTNWNAGLPTNDLTTDIGAFSGSVTTNLPTLTGTRSISGLSFQSSGWTINGTGAMLSIGSNGITTSAASGSNTIKTDINLGAAQSWNVGLGNTLVLSGSITGTNALLINGAGTVKISGSANINNATTVSSGTLILAVESRIGATGTTGSLTLNGGVVSLASTTGTMYVGNGASAPGALTINSGVLTVDFLNMNTGAANNFVMTGGTLNVNSFTRSGNMSFLGGTMNVGTRLSFYGSAITVGGSNTQMAINLNGNGGNVSKFSNGAASAIILAANGTLNVDNSVYNYNDRLDSTSDSGADSLITMNGGALNFIGNSTQNTTETFSGIIVNKGSSTVGITSLGKSYVVTSGTGGSFTGLTRTAGATVLFRGTNLGQSGTGTATSTNLLLGTPSAAGLVGTGSASGGSTGVTNLVILPYAVGDTSATGLGTDLVTYDTTRGIRTLAANEYVSTVSGAIAGGTDNNVKLASVDTLTTSGTINGLVVSSGTLNGTGFGLAVNSGAVLATGSNNQINTGSLNFGAREGIVTTNGNLLISGTVTGSAGLTKSGTGVLTLSGSNTYTGTTTLNQGAISISSGANFGGSTAINFNGGSLQATGTASVTVGITLNNTSDVNAFNVANGARLELLGVVTGTGALATTGSGTLIFSRTNSYTGATLINSGTLQIGNGSGAGSISTASAIINNGTLAFNRYSGLVQGTDFANVISGTGAVAVIGGTATLSGSNTYTGTTSVNGGMLNVANVVAGGNASTLGNATSAVVLGGASTTGTLNYTGNSATFTRGLTISAGGGELDTATSGQTLTIATGGINNTSGGLLSVSGAGNTLVTSAIGGGAGGLTKNGAGRVILAGANTYTGATTINSGTLQIGNGDTTGSIAASSAIVDNATLAFNRSNGAVQGVDFGAISGTGNVVVAGGSLTLNASNAYNVATVLNAGTLLNITLASGAQWTPAGAITGAGALAINGLGTLTLSASSSYTGGTVISSGTVIAANGNALGLGKISVVGTTANTVLQLQNNLSSAWNTSVTLSGTTGALGIVDTGTSSLTLNSGTLTINSGGVLQVSGTVGTYVLSAATVVNSGGLIQSTNAFASASQNYLNGDVTLNSGAILSTNIGSNYLTGINGRLIINGNFVANAGSTISDNFVGYVGLAGTSAVINSGVTLLSATGGSTNGSFSFVLNRGHDTTALTSAVALDTLFIRDQDGLAVGSNYTALLTVSATGQNVGQILITNLDGLTTPSTTTVKLGSDLMVRSGKAIIAQSYGNASKSPVSLDLNGHTYDGTLAAGNGAWAPNTTSNAITGGSSSTFSPWSVVSTSGTGTFRAGSFDLTGVYTDVTIGANVILAATTLSGTTDLGLRTAGTFYGSTVTAGTGTIDPTSTFVFSGAGSHTLKTSGTYANGTSRIIGNVQVGDGTSASTLNLGSAITTGTGSSVTVNQSSTLALGVNNLTTNGLLSVAAGAAVSSSTGIIALGGDITTTGTGNSSIGAAINTTGTANRNITVANAGSSLNISRAISGSANQLTKLGAGTLILGGVSTYSGATVVSAGELDVNGSLAAASTVTVSSGATLGGSGSVNGAVNVTDGTVNGGGLSMGDATYYGASTLKGITSANTITVASGTTSLTGHATSAGTLSVSLGGTLKNTGVATAGNVSVGSGGTLTNNGTVNGSVSVSGLINGNGTINGDLALVSGTLAPGNSPGTTTVNGDYLMDAFSKLSMQVTSGTSAGTYDQVVVNGMVSLAGTLDLSSLSTLTKLGDAITLLVNNSGQTTDTEGFFGTVLVGGSSVTLGAGNTFSITIGDTTTQYALAFASSTASTDGVANDLELMVVPEPSTWAMLVGGIGALFIFRKMRKFQVLG